MSDELIRELELDLQKEKEKIFFNKYKYHILSVIIISLLGVGGYQLYQNTQHTRHENAALNYKAVQDFHANPSSSLEKKVKKQIISSETIRNVPEYLAMATLTEYNSLIKEEADFNKKIAVFEHYFKNIPPKHQSMTDAVVRIHHIALVTQTNSFQKTEQLIKEYLLHPFAVKNIAYELALLSALTTHQKEKAGEYYNLLKRTDDQRVQNKLLLYKTHPLLLEYLAKPLADSIKNHDKKPVPVMQDKAPKQTVKPKG